MGTDRIGTTRYALVPVELDADMHTRLTELARAHIPGDDDHVRDEFTLFAVHAWRALWRASPGGGRVMAEQRKAVAKAIQESDGICDDPNCRQCLEAADAAIAALGLKVEGAL